MNLLVDASSIMAVLLAEPESAKVEKSPLAHIKGTAVNITTAEMVEMLRESRAE